MFIIWNKTAWSQHATLSFNYGIPPLVCLLWNNLLLAALQAWKQTPPLSQKPLLGCTDICWLNTFRAEKEICFYTDWGRGRRQKGRRSQVWTPTLIPQRCTITASTFYQSGEKQSSDKSGFNKNVSFKCSENSEHGFFCSYNETWRKCPKYLGK